MGVLSSVYLAIVELALWTFGTISLSFLTSSRLVQIGVLITMIFWRFKWMGILGLFKPFAFSWPVMYLLASGLTKSKAMLSALTSNPTSTVVSPLYEEIIYRYIVPKVVESRVLPSFKYSDKLAVGISALLFCFAHRHSGSIGDLAVCLTSGIALNLRAAKNKSILETFLIHALHNLHVISGKQEVEGQPAGGWLLSLIPTAVSQYIGPIGMYGAMVVWDMWRGK